MTESETMQNELSESNRLVRACFTCGKPPRIAYDPGCTFLQCDCGYRDWSHDFQPRELARKWNNETWRKKWAGTLKR
jgi:hypothetical protein